MDCFWSLGFVLDRLPICPAKEIVHSTVPFPESTTLLHIQSHSLLLHKDYAAKLMHCLSEKALLLVSHDFMNNQAENHSCRLSRQCCDSSLIRRQLRQNWNSALCCLCHRHRAKSGVLTSRLHTSVQRHGHHLHCKKCLVDGNSRALRHQEQRQIAIYSFRSPGSFNNRICKTSIISYCLSYSFTRKPNQLYQVSVMCCTGKGHENHVLVGKLIVCLNKCRTGVNAASCMYIQCVSPNPSVPADWRTYYSDTLEQLISW